MQDFRNRAAAECRTAGKHLEQDCAGGKKIAAHTEGFSADLFGRHVPRRPHQHACARQCRFVRDRLVELRPGESEVEQLHAVHGQEDIRRLQVAMDDAAAVKRGECGEHAECDRYRVGAGEGASCQPLRQHFALEELHRDEEPACVLANFVDLADVRVIHARGCTGLPPQPLTRPVVVRRSREGLHRNHPLETGVACRVDNAHTAFAQLALDYIGTDTIGRSAPVPGAVAGGEIDGDAAPVSHSYSARKPPRDEWSEVWFATRKPIIPPTCRGGVIFDWSFHVLRATCDVRRADVQRATWTMHGSASVERGSPNAVTASGS